MYIPAHFNESRPEVLKELITSAPFGMLVTHGNNGLDANHIPFELIDDAGAPLRLSAHVARANPVWQEVPDGADVLVVFRAGDAYISPTWYPSKQETHKQVPTWNYMVVHAHGKLRVRDDERYVRGVVARLTRRHEATQAAPWKMTDSPADFIDSLLQAIVGIEIEVTRLEGKSKLSQNKDRNDLRQAGNMAKASGAERIGDAMLAAAEHKAG
jgi:transcriptional regulator